MTETRVGAIADQRRGVDEWATYDEFAAGIDTYRLPNTSLAGRMLELTLDDGSAFAATFGPDTATWSATGSIDAHDAVQVRDGVY